MVNDESNQQAEAPRPRRRWAKVGTAVGAVIVIGALAPPVRATLKQPTPGYDAPAAAVVLSYHCSSSAAESDESYTIVGTVPAEVVQGTEFTLDDVVLTGTPSVDLLLVSLTMNLVAPIGATSVDGLSRTFPGPGATSPPGPIAQAGVPNSTTPSSFTFVASGDVGTTIDFHTGTVSSVAADIADPSSTVPVTCSRTGGGAFASTTIVAEPPDTTSTTSTSTTTTTIGVVSAESGETGDGAAVLGTDQTPAHTNPLLAG